MAKKPTTVKRRQPESTIGFPGRLVRLRPANINDPTSKLIISAIIDAGSPKPSPKNPANPPSRWWCSLLRYLQISFDAPGFVDDVTSLLGGETEVRTYADIAGVFEVSLATVKSWAAEGMPKDGPPYSLVDVLSWRLMKDAHARNGASGNRLQFN